MKLLVTGGAGFIGSHLCERLLADGHWVLAVDSLTDYYERDRKLANLEDARTSERFRLVEADLADGSVASLLDGVDGVFHLAAQPGIRGSWGATFGPYVRNNVEAVQRVLEAIRRRPVPLVFASSSSVYGDARSLPVAEDAPLDPISPYGVTKLAGEHLARLYAREHGMHVIVLRYFTVYGPRQRPDMAFSRFTRAALEDVTVPVLGDGTQSRDFTFVGDAVDATARALHAAAGSVYNVGGGSVATVNEVLDILGSLVGRPVRVERLARAAGDVRHTWADTTRACTELGWRPRTSLREGLAAQLASEAAANAPRAARA